MTDQRDVQFVSPPSPFTPEALEMPKTPPPSPNDASRSHSPSGALTLHRLFSTSASVNNLPRIWWDIRDRPSRAIQMDANSATTTITSEDLYSPAIIPRTNLLRLVSEPFPWVITARNPGGVTCFDVINAIYDALDLQPAPSDWSDLSAAERTGITANFNTNCAHADRSTNGGLKRVDWIGPHTIFRGLEEDGLTALRAHDSNEQGSKLTLVLQVP
jgi:hypothetical protein